MSFSFRLRFKISDRVRLPFDGSEILVYDEEPIKIKLRAHHSKKSIKESSQLVLWGKGYQSAEIAQIAGENARDQLITAFSMFRFPANFGDRTPKGHISDYGLKMLQERSGKNILNDVHGLQVYETKINPVFSTFTAKGVVNKSKKSVLKAFRTAFSSNSNVDERKRLAFELFSASFFTNYVDARFMLLMMSLETLIEQKEKNEEERILIDQLIAKISASGIKNKDSIISGLTNLKKESIGAAGRRMAEKLSENYMDMSPSKFFNHCYELRSKLVHGHIPRPSFEEVGKVSAQLEVFVSNLILIPNLEE